jgi:hypothetical protein
VRDQTLDGEELVDFMLQVMRGEKVIVACSATRPTKRATPPAIAPVSRAILSGVQPKSRVALDVVKVLR